MPPTKQKPVLRCPECWSRVFEIQGPVTNDAVIQCAECGHERGPLPEIMSQLEARVREQDDERRRRRFH